MAVSARAHASNLSTSKAKAAPEELRTIAINLYALLEPHKKHRRLTLRVERLPAKARFSSGQRNGDGSWSLTRDDLEDLKYLLPDGVDENHTLSIRVIELENGKTIAVLDFHVGQKPGTSKKAAAKAGSDGEAKDLKGEVARLASLLAERDAELSDAQEKLEAALQQSESELEAARSSWKKEEARRYEESEAQWKDALSNALNDASTQFLADRERHTSMGAELQALRGELERATAALADRDEQLAHARQESLKLSASKPSPDAGLEAARVAWKAEESARFAAAEARWKDASAKSFQEACAQMDAQRKLWQDEEAARAAAAQAQWQIQLDKAVAEARAQAAVPKASGNESEVRALQDALKAAQTKLAERDAAQAQLQGQFDKAVAEARAQAAAPKANNNDSELRALQDTLKVAQAKLAERDAALIQLSKVAEAEQSRRQQDVRDAVARAESEQKERDAAALASAESRWRSQSERATQDAIERAEAAEAAVTKMRLRVADERALLDELTAMRSALGERELELTQLRERNAHSQFVAEQTALHPQRTPPTDAEKRAAAKRKFIRDGVVAASLTVGGALLYMGAEAVFSGPEAAPVESVAVPGVVEPLVLTRAVVTQPVKLRAGPDRSESVVARLVRGREVWVVEAHKEWTLVRTQKDATLATTREGWVRSSELSVEAN